MGSGPARTLGDAFAESSFFKTDPGSFDLRWQATRFETMLSGFDTCLSTIDIDVFGLFSHLGKNRDFLWRHFGKPPEDRHVLRLLADPVSELADFQRGEKMGMAGEHAEFPFNAGRDHFLDLLTE